MKNQLNITAQQFRGSNATSRNDSQQNQAKDQNQEDSTICNFVIDFIRLYSYAQYKEKIAIIIGIIVGIGSGVSHPLFLYLWFQELNLAINNQQNLSSHLNEFQQYLYYFIGLGLGVLIVNSLLFAIWKFISRSISKKIRIRYLQQFIKLTLPDVQKRNGYEWANDFKTHTLNIEKSIGDKVALFLNLIGIVVSGVTSALIIRWTFSLYMLLITPLGIIILVYFIYIQVKKKEINAESNKKAENKAIQATAMIKTVKMLNGQDKEAEDYRKQLMRGQNKLKQYNIRLGMATGLFYFIQYLFFGVGFLMGIQCIKGSGTCPTSTTGSRYQIDEFLSVFFQIFFCTYNFLQLGSNYSQIKSAIQSSKRIYQFIDEPKINRNSMQIHTPTNISAICFYDVEFHYPLNPQNSIIKDLNIEFEPQRFNAIVGTTGSGKSTIIQLLLKQYNVKRGQIIVDGIDLNLIKTQQWLNRIGIVTQQPVLFNGTIKENVLVGKEDATDQEVINALTQANIYSFVQTKPQGVDFQIGVGGSKLSGGQKQRIAIARALVKKPSLLILDQATSALDPATELQIQSSLEDIRLALQNKITIICIAHRISTIRNADKIFLIKNGQVAEYGKYEQLQYFKQKQFKNRVNPQCLLSLKKQQTKAQVQNKKPSAQMSQQNEQMNGWAEVKASARSVYFQLLGYTREVKWYTICIVLAIVIGGTHLASSVLISYHVDQLNRYFLFGESTLWCQNLPSACNDKLESYFIQSQKYLYGLIGLAFFTFLPYFVQINLLSKIENEIAFNLKNHLFDKILNFEVKFFEAKHNESGGVASKFGNDAREASTLISTYIPVVLSNFCIAVGAVVICFSYDWRFGFLSLIVTPLIALSFYIAMLFIGGYQDSSLEKLHRCDQIANELITCIKTVFVLNYQQRFLDKFKRYIDEPFEETIKVGAKIGFLYGMSFFILDLVVGLSLYSSVRILQNDPSIQPISICIYMIVSTLSGFIIAHTSASKQAANRIMQLIFTPSQADIQRKHVDSPRNMDVSNIKGKIEFKNISFKYKKDDSRLILNNVSLTISAGSKVAFVGESGCGKSTLLQLLLRFYEYQGEILIDGVNIYDYDLKQQRQIFSMLNQQPSLFAGTIDQNIRYNTDIKQQRMQDICSKACAYTLNQHQIESLDEQIEEFRRRKVGPKGSNISGGEKQRVACARALARNSSIFLMDEGTSALDRITQIKVQKGVNEQFRQKTVITVAHRIETIIHSDQVFVFSQGEVVQFGKPQILMKKRGYFFNFVNGSK